jgi:hypothetical protein
MTNDQHASRIELADLEEPVAAMTGAVDGSDLDAPLPLTIVLIVIAA